MSTRIAIMWPQTSGFWAAGAIYTDNLLKSVALARDASVEIVVIEPTGGEFSARHRQAFPDVDYASFDPTPKRSTSLTRFRGRLQRKLGLPSTTLARAIRDARVDVTFGNLDGESGTFAPWVGWIPDFQHLHYPEFFAPGEVDGRNVAYMQWAKDCSLMLLSSRDCEKDFSDFAPQLSEKARVASFVSLLPDSYFEQDASEASRQLGLTRPYVIVPNQWWRHKNHETVIRAARLLKDRGVSLTWVFTGALQDHRDPSYSSRMLQFISELAVGDVVRPLGMLPRMQQVQLMRDAEFVVQPSLFEGWSTVVEDVKTMGQRIVLSDLAVHREQEPPGALFFDPLSVEALADAVTSMLNGRVERGDEAAARASARQRAAVFGKRFAAVCVEAAGMR